MSVCFENSLINQENNLMQPTTKPEIWNIFQSTLAQVRAKQTSLNRISISSKLVCRSPVLPFFSSCIAWICLHASAATWQLLQMIAWLWEEGQFYLHVNVPFAHRIWKKNSFNTLPHVHCHLKRGWCSSWMIIMQCEAHNLRLWQQPCGVWILNPQNNVNMSLCKQTTL